MARDCRSAPAAGKAAYTARGSLHSWFAAHQQPAEMNLRIESEPHDRELDATDLAIQVRLGKIEISQRSFSLVSTKADISAANLHRVIGNGLLELRERCGAVPLREATREPLQVAQPA